MEIETGVFVRLDSLPNGTSILKNVLTKTNQMDRTLSDGITINSELSKDGGVAGFDDATNLRTQENGVSEDDTMKKPIITLAKAVSLKNFESMSTSITIETSGRSNDDDISEHNIVSENDNENDSIVLSESEGEEAPISSLTKEVISNLTTVAGKISVRVPSIETNSSTNDTTDDVEILSEANRSSTSTPTGKKQVKVVVPSSRKSDGVVKTPITVSPELKDCLQCCKTQSCTMMLEFSGVKCYVCSEKCLVENRFAQKASLQRAFARPTDSNRPVVVRKCGHCKDTIVPNDNTLSWETMDFCNEDCLKQYQSKLGMNCSNCQKQCQEQSLGKYCVRFGFDIRQFCHSSCLEEFKRGIKVCSFCQEDIPGNKVIMAAINDRQNKEFCSEECLTSYDKMSSNMPIRLSANTCDVCKKFKLVTVEVVKAGKCYTLCSDVCFNAFKFVNPNPMGFCDMCRKHFDTENCEEQFYTFADETPITFCSKTCMNAYVIFKRKIVQCNWCKVKKYNFDMIKKIFSNRQVMMLCSFHCFSMWKQSPKRNTCDHCKTFGQIQYHLGMSDGTLRSFCGHDCLMTFQLQFKKVPVTPSSARPLDSSATLAYPVTTATSVSPKVTQVSVKAPITKKSTENTAVVMATGTTSLATICAPPSMINDNVATIPVISNVTSLDSSMSLDKSITNSKQSETLVTVNTPKLPAARKPVGVLINKPTTPTVLSSGSQTIVKQQLLLVPPPPIVMCNKSTNFNCYPATKSKGVYCRPLSQPIATQYCIKDFDGDDVAESMDEDEDEIDGDGKKKSVVTRRVVREVPVPIPIPYPVFIPVPIPLFSIPMPSPVPIPIPVPVCIPLPHQSLERVLDEIMDLCKDLPFIASERRKLKEAEGNYSYQNNVINVKSRTNKRGYEEEAMDTSDSNDHSNKRRKVDEGSSSSNSRCVGRPGDQDDSSQNGSVSGNGSGGDDSNPNQTFTSSIHASKKLFQNIYGVNAWRKWVLTKNKELAESGDKLFGTELLWLSNRELSESLCLFVVEFCKPTGEPYSPDIIYYLLLGIQSYLTEKGKSVDIFTDEEFDKFHTVFDDLITKETNHLLPDSAVPRELLLPRIEEEHLLQSGCLGAQSPFILLFTMLYFITKGFHITDVEGHMGLAFSQIMRQWPRGQNSEKVTTYKSLRYFPPNQTRDGENSKKKFEILSDYNICVDNARFNPVDLYVYYLSKCPESVRNRSDVFYLEPESSYLAESPTWYTTQPLSKSTLSRMFNRLTLVKEISLVINSRSSQ